MFFSLFRIITVFTTFLSKCSGVSLSLFLALFLVSSCDDNRLCKTSEDCKGERICVDGTCKESDEVSTDTVAPIDDLISDAIYIDIQQEVGPEREIAWVELATQSDQLPPNRMNHFSVYDSRSDSIIVFGGFDPYGDLGRCCVSPYIDLKDVWRLDMESEQWELVAELNSPLLSFAGVEPAIDYDKNRIVIIAAVEDSLFGSDRNIALDLSTWEVTSIPNGPWPANERPISAAHSKARKQIIVHNAYSANMVEGTWVFDLQTDTWTTLNTQSSPPLRFHTPIIASRDNKVWLHGGFLGEGYTGDLWEINLDTETWNEIELDPPLPERGSHKAVWEPIRGLMVVFGGYVYTRSVETVLIDIDNQNFSEISLTPEPIARRDHSMVLDTLRRRVIMFGGAIGSEQALSDTWALILP